jgi:hypothetical protein
MTTGRINQVTIIFETGMVFVVCLKPNKNPSRPNLKENGVLFLNLIQKMRKKVIA